MAEDIKFTEEELKDIQDLSTTYQKRQAELGQIAVQKILMEQRVNALIEREEAIKSEWAELQTNEKNLVNTLSEKYGQGTLDPNTGKFEPVKNS
mgnify:FL=1|tara:strand:+ start:90 stop:371 length:282 start_codon:yes stop_codon:yes gene_type:complete